MKQIGQL